jgi:UDP-glucose 4-epimerase
MKSAELAHRGERTSLRYRRAAEIRFARFVVSATTPFERDDLPALRHNAAAVLDRHVPEYQAVYAKRGFKMLPTLDRV